MMAAAAAARCCPVSLAAVRTREQKTPPALNFKVSLAGKEVNLAGYLGKVVLVVNVAGKCGLTPQYEQLNRSKIRAWLAVLGFPCNQFRGQERHGGRDSPVLPNQLRRNRFDMFAKIDVNGEGLRAVQAPRPSM